MDVIGLVVNAATAFATKTVADSRSSTAVAAAYAAAASATIDLAATQHGERSPEWAETVAAIGNVTDASALLHGDTPVGRSAAVDALLQEFTRRLAAQLQELISPAQLAVTDAILVALFDIRLDVRRLADRRTDPPLRPLTIDLDVDGNWRRLRVHNPNTVTAQGCSVKLVEYAAAADLPPGIVLPSRGFRFGWTTHGRDMPTRYADIPPMARDYADLHQVIPEQGYFTHVAPGAYPQTYIPFWGLPAGTYSYELAVASGGGDRIPTTTLAITAVYDGSDGLNLNTNRFRVG